MSTNTSTVSGSRSRKISLKSIFGSAKSTMKKSWNSIVNGSSMWLLLITILLLKWFTSTPNDMYIYRSPSFYYHQPPSSLKQWNDKQQFITLHTSKKSILLTVTCTFLNLFLWLPITNKEYRPRTLIYVPILALQGYSSTVLSIIVDDEASLAWNRLMILTLTILKMYCREDWKIIAILSRTSIKVYT